MLHKLTQKLNIAFVGKKKQFSKTEVRFEVEFEGQLRKNALKVLDYRESVLKNMLSNE